MNKEYTTHKTGICISALQFNAPEEALYRAIDVEELVSRYLPDRYNTYEPKKSVLSLTGAIYGDIAGSRYEFANHTEIKLPESRLPEYCFTDDTVMSLATAETVMNKRKHLKYRNRLTALTAEQP